MSDLNPYIQTLVIDSLAGKSFSDQFHRRDELIEMLRRQVEVVVSAFKVADLIDDSATSDLLFDKLLNGKVIRKSEQEFAGTYYRVNNAQLINFRSNFLKQDPIALTAAQIGERFFPDVFDGYRASRGIESLEENKPIARSIIQQQDWVAISAGISSDRLSEINQKVSELIQAIHQSDLDERLKKNALARAEGVLKLLEASDPPWEVIVELLNNRYFTAFLNSMAIVQLIIGSLL